MIGERECPCCGQVVLLKPEEARKIVSHVLDVVADVYGIHQGSVENPDRKALCEVEACFIFRCVSWEMSGASMRRFASMVGWERRTLGYAVGKARDLGVAYPAVREALETVRRQARRSLARI